MGTTSRRGSSASGSGSGSGSGELAREHDLNKHYQPWLNFKKLHSVPVDTGPASDQSRPPHCSPDPTLTAFAQLAALRLDAKRGMVSLLETQTQIILAEATQTLSLVDGTRHAPGDHIWLGNVALPRRDCMDEHAIGAITVSQDAEGRDVEVSALVVNDTLHDDRFKNRPYVTSRLGVRFYAGVPIVTKLGHSIGVYAVSDTRPRPQVLTYDELLFMRDVSQIIAAHLEGVMGSMGRVSARDFMRGISYFLEDLSEYKYRINNTDPSARVSSAAQLSNKMRAATADPQTTPLRGRPSQPGFANPLQTSSNSSKASSSLPPSRTPSKYFSTPKDGASNLGETPDLSKKNTRRIFVQASQLLCEQAKASGCIFVDAASGLFTGQSQGEIAPLGSADPWPTVDVASQSAENEEPNSSDSTGNPKSYLSEPGGLLDASSGDRLDEMADVLSLSLARGESDELCSGDIIKRKGLKNCIIRYPFGKCFYLSKGRIMADNGLAFDEVITGGGPTHTSDVKARDLKDQSPVALPQEVLKYIPKAKWLVFLPLFNYSQGQWCAAGFIWGNDFKIGDPDDALPYFKTFGSCMMSEVASMEVLNRNVAKSTFIASISHDLRSPLHGLLGNLEFLEGTLTSAYQMNLVGAIETCGKTLLDTIDHLLHYAKINNLKRTSSSRREKRLRDAGPTSEQTSLSTSFDIAILLEEVVEAVFAGQTFRKIKTRQHDPVDQAREYITSMSLDDETPLNEQVYQGSARFSGKVLLILNIEKTSWFFQGQAGALRRVIMNIVGNAIKYCTSGFIEISLKANQTTSSNVDVELNVTDTGIGMSDEFLANHLFKPFSQEDSFTAGTGLGLSITSQIVSNLHGKITVDSEKYVGTHVNITIPMEVALPPTNMGEQEDIRDAVELGTGKKACILHPVFSDATSSNSQLSKLESSVSTLFQEWFGMEVLQSRNVNAGSDVAIYIYAEPPPIEYLVEKCSDREERGLPGANAALLIICTNAFEAAALQAAGVKRLTSLGNVIEVISQPVGIRKLARVLLQCLQRVEGKKRREDRSVSSGSSSPTFPSREVQKRATEIAWNNSPVIYDQVVASYRPSIESLHWKSEIPEIKTFRGDSAQVSSPAPPTATEAGRLYGSKDSQQLNVQSENTTGPRPRVLLVDDNAINLKLLVTFMKKLKLSYAEAINGLDAVTKFKEADMPFDIVLMDLQMPIMDGLEATREIREYEQKNLMENAYIVAITGVGDGETRQEAMDAGMSEYLTKPVKLKVLRQILLER
ncbi:hypothetical protein CHU98_g2548 [Xylaria longipes]|nr:hypothetical protein CHU98_g2548 [Xylaria longipes]